MWRSFESAPRDGSEFLAWDPLGEGRVVLKFLDGEFVNTWDLVPNPDCTDWHPLPGFPEGVVISP